MHLFYEFAEFFLAHILAQFLAHILAHLLAHILATICNKTVYISNKEN